MAKQVFVAGGLTAQDYSYAKLVVGLAVSDPAVASLLPDPPPEGIVERMDAATLVTPTNEQAIITDLLQQVADLEEQIEQLTPPTP